MKFITTLSLLLFFFFSTNAQYNKGAKLLGGSIYIVGQQSKYEDPLQDVKTTSISFAPYLGSFYRQNRVAGVLASYGSNKRTNVPASQIFGAGVFLRQYFPIGKSAFSFFAHEQLAGSFGKTYENYSGSNVKFKTSNITASIRPAIAYSIFKKLQVELQLPELISVGYYRNKPSGAQNQSVADFSTFGIQSGFSNYSVGNIGVGGTFVF